MTPPAINSCSGDLLIWRHFIDLVLDAMRPSIGASFYSVAIAHHYPVEEVFIFMVPCAEWVVASFDRI